jgi:glycosyltransferase involved in cell wall biosynthesis
VIGTHEAGTTTVVEDGVEGIIVRPNDPQQIAAAMIRLANDREANQRMGDAAFARLRGHTWQNYGDRLLARYDVDLAKRQ